MSSCALPSLLQHYTIGPKSKRPGARPGRSVIDDRPRLFRRLVLLFREPLVHLRIDARAVLLHLGYPERMDPRILILVFDLVAAQFHAERHRLLLHALFAAARAPA